MKKARKKAFKAKEGSRLTDKDAQVVGPELERLIQRNGGVVEAEHVVEAATLPRSPLHPYFEWDDAKAAHEHRLTTARTLMRSITIVRMSARGEEVQVRDILRVNEGYTTADRVLANPDWTEQLLARMLSELEAFKRRYETWNSIQGVRDVLSELDALVERRRVQKAA